MEENQNEEKINNTEEVKNTNAQTKTQACMDLIKTMFKDPLGAVKTVAEDKSNKFIWLAVILVSTWTALELIYVLASTLPKISFKYFVFSSIMNLIGGIVGALIGPALAIFALSLLVFLFNKNSKRSLLHTLSAITIVKTPVIAAAVISFLRLIPGKVYPITNAFSGLCSIISIVASYFLIKEIYGEKEDNKFMIKFIIIYAIYAAVALVAGYIGINI